jgi:lipooligosaccharide transport system permease protein
VSSATIAARVAPVGLFGAGRAMRLVERNVLVYRRTWIVFVSGFFEPLFYLLSIGVGISKLTGDITLANGSVMTYTVFVAPAMMATAAMNGAMFDASFNIFHKLKFAKLYDAVLSTPMSTRDVAVGEITWALLRGMCYATAFLVVMVAMGLVSSWWAIFAVPASVLIGWAFAAVAMAATTYMRSWQDFEFITLTSVPLFLFSATFYPLETYPRFLQIIVECTPLYQGVALIRGLTTGVLSMGMIVNVAYLGAMGLIGVAVASRRLATLLLT